VSEFGYRTPLLLGIDDIYRSHFFKLVTSHPKKLLDIGRCQPCQHRRAEEKRNLELVREEQFGCRSQRGVILCLQVPRIERKTECLLALALLALNQDFQHSPRHGELSRGALHLFAFRNPCGIATSLRVHALYAIFYNGERLLVLWLPKSIIQRGFQCAGKGLRLNLNSLVNPPLRNIQHQLLKLLGSFAPRILDESFLIIATHDGALREQIAK
jgi:hypothetical protein